MARTPKPMRQRNRRLKRALARQGPTYFEAPDPPVDETERTRMAMEDEMLMRIVPPTVRKSRMVHNESLPHDKAWVSLGAEEEGEPL